MSTTFKFQAMNAVGEEIEDTIEAATQDEAQATIRQMGYFITRIKPVPREERNGQKRKEVSVGSALSDLFVALYSCLPRFPRLRGTKLANEQQLDMISRAVSQNCWSALAKHGDIKELTVRQMRDGELILELLYADRKTDPPEELNGFRIIEIVEMPD